MISCAINLQLYSWYDLILIIQFNSIISGLRLVIKPLKIVVNISHSLNFRLYWISIVFQTFEGIKGMLLHLEEAPSEERVNARFFCAFIGFRALASLGLFLLGRQVLFSLFQDIFNVLDFLQRFNYLLEYSAMIFRYEISLVEGLHNNHQVGLYLRDLHVCVVFCVVLYNILIKPLKIVVNIILKVISNLNQILLCLGLNREQSTKNQIYNSNIFVAQLK
ncbi:Hypothetical_protein [Hexamita inflata]|uniref:Hypothetical_protein n=1 Tax=Hexamita inflata TaxID=28002 RepID=A0AA86QA33_9EUKA|nr:Hypothetical protein HINF_LOCUS42785 [Hexamita inflata]